MALATLKLLKLGQIINKCRENDRETGGRDPPLLVRRCGFQEVWNMDITQTLEEAELGQQIVDEIESHGLAINQCTGGKQAREGNSPRLPAGLAASVNGRLLRKLLWSWNKEKGSATLPWAVGGRCPGFPLDHLPKVSREEIRTEMTGKGRERDGSEE